MSVPLPSSIEAGFNLVVELVVETFFIFLVPSCCEHCAVEVYYAFHENMKKGEYAMKVTRMLLIMNCFALLM